MAKKPKYGLGEQVLYRGHKYTIEGHIASPVGHFYLLQQRLGYVDQIELTALTTVLTGNQFKTKPTASKQAVK